MLALYNTLIVLLTVAAMELVAALAHKYIMHGWGWGWHESHHEPRTSWFEVNDLYAVVFAVLAIVLIALGTWGVWPLQWIGAGMTLYGALYFMERLYLAHRLHHAVRGKEDCVSFGFLYAPPVEKLQATLRQRKARRTTSADAARARPDAASVSQNEK